MTGHCVSIVIKFPNKEADDKEDILSSPDTLSAVYGGL